MKTIVMNLIELPPDVAAISQHQVNHLQYKDAMLEATLLDQFYMGLTSTCATTIDLRTALYRDFGGNTGVLICRGVTHIDTLSWWYERPRVWTLSDINILHWNQTFLLQIADMNGRSIKIQAPIIEFYTGIVKGIGSVGKDIEENNLKDYLDTIPKMTSEIEITGLSLNRI